MRLPASVIVCLCVFAGATPSSAQPERRVGVTMGYPNGVGVLWHVTSRVALRPEINVTRSTVETTTETTVPAFPGTTSTFATTSSQSETTLVAGLGLLVTLHDADRLRLYLVPRAAWFGSSRSNGGEDALGSVSSDNDGVQASGSFGAQYGVSGRVAVFGELGVHYARQTVSSTYASASIRSRVSSTGLRSAVGLVLYF
ncbi:MAG: hypothetical protein R2708_16095 [Vicinamibacterales bacterium]